ncbi:5-deoxy-glucuronate isomerase [Humibacillus sp. DSM 29435]|uniref:5-deoxy-glucuronate isomerase n=1 Tax=Humibacillus sp. DSM 29435 TaxID=1869167 RepID=UPI000871FF35|nr:5-deoxy-glucuronate isomerase [Humibacillus sp. DSM 29435]OFE17911.1 5-deoxy-glucuronate isomerase [Humibacillus sp. DSM 29435]
MTDNAQWVRPLGSAAREGWDVVIEPDASSWSHTGLYIGVLSDRERRTLEAGDRELLVVPLSGSVTVTCVEGSGARHDVVLAGRASVFTGPTDTAYVPRGARLQISAVGDARVAVCTAVATKSDAAHSFRHLAAADVPVELRGAGIASREVRNFGTPGVLDADSMIACEVITPAGNWSSYPPHKHDEERPGVESELEEIYYFEVAPTAASPDAAGADPIGYQRVYGTQERPIDVLTDVRSGDVVLVPHGWHGPAMAVPGYDLYYLNVMAGPGPERAWLICDDPAHGWVRDTWAALPVDPRLPLGGMP